MSRVERWPSMLVVHTGVVGGLSDCNAQMTWDVDHHVHYEPPHSLAIDL